MMGKVVGPSYPDTGSLLEMSSREGLRQLDAVERGRRWKLPANITIVGIVGRGQEMVEAIPWNRIVKNTFKGIADDGQ